MLLPLADYLQMFTLQNIWNGIISALQFYNLLPR